MKITIKDLKDKGACHYSWVRPDEPALEGFDRPHLPHGGFAYLFHDAVVPTGDPAAIAYLQKSVLSG